jgi:outer membrane protein assembly factor BamA
VGEGIPAEEDLFASLNCQPGFSCSRAELSQDIKQLFNTGLFESVNAKVLPNKRGRFRVVFDFVEKRYPEIKTFAVEGARVLPPAVVAEARARLDRFRGQAFTMETMAAIKNVVEGWYQARGFGLSYISHFTGMPTGDVVAHVVEGRTAKVGVVYVDEDGNPSKKAGSVPAAYILKHVPVEAGALYNMNDGRAALQNVFALELFDNVQVFPRQNERDPSRVEVDVMVREKPVQTADVELEWQVAPGDDNRPSLVSLVPGGTVTYEHRNLLGRAATVAASVNTKNFLAPADDLSYRFVYSQPYALGLDDPRRTRLSATLFNARKLCGVFTPGPAGEEVPPVWVDRMGAKVAVTEQYSRASRGSLGLVAQEVVTRDEAGAPCTRGVRATPYGQYVADGPPTTLSGTGRDRVVYAQGSLVRDTTYMVNGQQLGARDVYAVSESHRGAGRWVGVLGGGGGGGGRGVPCRACMRSGCCWVGVLGGGSGGGGLYRAARA